MISELENALHEVSKSLDLDLSKKFEDSDVLVLNNKSVVAVEYGRLLIHLSSLLHLVTKISLQQSLTVDLNYVQGNLLQLNTKSDLDLGHIDKQIESIEIRLNLLENWVSQ